MQHSVNVCLNLNTSYKNVYAFAHFTGQMNVTQTPVPTPLSMECVCSISCSDAQGRCKAGFGCFSHLKPDGKNGYLVEKGCIKNEVHHKMMCGKSIIVCCEVNLCNWNITPPFPTEKPSKF